MTDAVRAAQLELELRAEVCAQRRTHARTHARTHTNVAGYANQTGKADTLPPLVGERPQPIRPCEIAGQSVGAHRCVHAALCGTDSPADRSACARSL
jgi:hypothetical protein